MVRDEWADCQLGYFETKEVSFSQPGKVRLKQNLSGKRDIYCESLTIVGECSTFEALYGQGSDDRLKPEKPKGWRCSNMKSPVRMFPRILENVDIQHKV